jgi:putative DNA primase/helicase
MVSEGLEIRCGAADSQGRRIIIATLGEMQHRHRFDTASQFHRRQFREAVVDKFNLGDDAHEFLEAQIIAQADAEDAKMDTGLSPVVVKMEDVQAEEIQWFWPNRIPLAKLCIIAGDPGLGKSFLTIDLAARCSRGTRWFDCDGSAPLGSTIILNCEDALADTVKPRLIAAGADCAKIVALQAVRGQDIGGEYERSIDLQRDLAVLEKAIADLTDCRLAIIDPLSAYLGKTDSHRNSDVRAVLAPLSAMAEKHQIAVVAVDHLTKGETKAIYKITGSIAFTGAARSVFAVTKDRDDPTERRRLLLPIKSNIAEKSPGLAYVLSPTHGVGGIPCVAWEPDEVSMSADEAMSAEPRRRGPAADEFEEATEFLRTALADGPRPTKEVEQEAREGYGIAKRTLERARKSLQVESFRQTVPGAWMLRLPNTANNSANAPESQQCGGLGGLTYLDSKNVLKSVSEHNTARLSVSGSLPFGDTF